ncbi:hypothetical protein [Calothrix rhizosoleniae]|uniref:hypothetical protein n=1 Tax=Calothrix rhizosoleniae TaxID=888997 RepID=UPI000B49AC55|nr:hypothetical protein [Calothrix rhizosoleniae]
MSLNTQFRKAVSSPLYHLSVEDLKPIALAFWHECYTPELSDLDLEQLRKAGYLIDRFRGYNCIPKAQKRELAILVKEVEQSLPEVMEVVDNVDNLEPLAQKWNLNEDISHVMSPLLEYQTRHYVHAHA